MMTNNQLTIAVPTFRRPESLRRLLESLRVALTRLPDAEARVVVVDNDPSGSARLVSAQDVGLEVHYVSQPIPGISETRNAAVRASRDSEFLAFVDDDEYVDPAWLQELFRVQREYDADVVAGPVYSVFAADAPQLVIESGLFDRATREEGTELHEAGGGNLLIRMSVFLDRDESEWFQEEFSLTGGEDSEFTRRIHKEGVRIVWASGAAAWEDVPSERASFRWLARRYRRTGAVDFRLERPEGLHPVFGFAKGCARVLVAAPPLAWHWVAGRRVDAASFKRFFRGVGYIEASTRGGYVEYARGQAS